MKKNLNFNDLALQYQTTKSEKDFTTLYKELRKIGSIAKNGLTVEIDDYEIITTNIAMMLREKIDTIVTENQSAFSYCYVSFRTKYYSLLKKYNRWVRESDMHKADTEDALSKFEKIIEKERGSEFEFEMFEEKAEVISPLYLSPERQVKEFYKIIDEMYEGKERILMLDIFTLRNDDEVGSASIWTSPEKISEKYGVKNRTTISARRTRAIEKISKELKRRIDASRVADGDLSDGSYAIGESKLVIKDGKPIEFASMDKRGNLLIKTKVDDKTTYITKQNQKGVKISEGAIDTESKKRIGVWSFFKDNGILDGRINYDHPNATFCLFDEVGGGELMGKLK